MKVVLFLAKADELQQMYIIKNETSIAFFRYVNRLCIPFNQLLSNITKICNTIELKSKIIKAGIYSGLYSPKNLNQPKKQTIKYCSKTFSLPDSSLLRSKNSECTLVFGFDI